LYLNKILLNNQRCHGLISSSIQLGRLYSTYTYQQKSVLATVMSPN